MAIPTFTNVRKGVDGGLVPGFGYNNDFAFTGSLFYGGKIFDGLGSFAQVTYDNVPNTIHWDNIDLRYAIPSELFGREAVFGVSANNNPTVNDVWNSTPAWGYPYLASELAPSPGAMTLIEGRFAQQVVGLNPYIYWNRLVYAEVGGYGTLSPRTLTTLGTQPEGTSAFQGIAPSWRLAIEPAWGRNTWEFGTFGLATNVIPDRMTGMGTDHLTDVGADTQYEFLGARDSFQCRRASSPRTRIWVPAKHSVFPVTRTTSCAPGGSRVLITTIRQLASPQAILMSTAAATRCCTARSRLSTAPTPTVGPSSSTISHSIMAARISGPGSM